MRRRIVVAIVSVTTVAVILFAVPLAFALAHLYREEEVLRLAQASAEAADRIPSSFPQLTDPIDLPAGHGDRHIALYSSDLRRVSGVGPVSGDAPVRKALRGDIHDAAVGDHLVLATPVTRGQRVVGALRAAIPLSVPADRTQDAILLMAAIGAGVVGISALIAAWHARRLARPVDQLALAASRLGDGDFTVRTTPSGIAEIDAVSTALDVTAARLDQMLTRERSFSAGASHQLRTPLTGLRITLESARLQETADQRAALDAALSEVDRLERTIDDLLALARDHPAEHAPMDVGPLLATLANDWQGRLAPEDRSFVVLAPNDLPRVNASVRALRQILDVLVDNAWRHGRGEIELRARVAPGGVAIEVSDEGPGISGDRQLIFRRRAPDARHHGIGLALARSLAEADGLRLDLINGGPKPVFAIFLPAHADDADEGNP